MGRLDKLEAESARLRRLEDEIHGQLAHVRGRLEGLRTAEAVLLEVASGIEAGTDETPQAAQPEGREPGPQGDAQSQGPSSDKERE